MKSLFIIGVRFNKNRVYLLVSDGNNHVGVIFVPETNPNYAKFLAYAEISGKKITNTTLGDFYTVSGSAINVPVMVTDAKPTPEGLDIDITQMLFPDEALVKTTFGL